MSIASTAFAATASAAKKPDLVIAGYAMHGQRYAFEDERGRIIPHDVTRNRGSARAGASITRAYLVHGPAADLSEIELGKRSVPGLGPKTQNADDIWDPTHIYNYPIGAYLVELCADDNHRVAESDETNNCALVRNSSLETIKVFIVRRVWDGHLGGVATLGEVTEQYKSSNAKLKFASPIRIEDGVFAYDFAGTVAYADTGGSGSCTYTGQSSRTFGPGGATAEDDITFDYLGRRYSGSAATDSGFHYSIKYQCGSSTFNYPGPVARTFFAANNESFAFGATTISGSNASSAQNWTWGFH